MDECQRFIAQYLADRCDLDIADIDVEANIFNVGYIDSLGVFSLLMSIEGEFGCTFSQEDMHSGRMLTVNGIAALLAEKQGG